MDSLSLIALHKLDQRDSFFLKKILSKESVLRDFT